MNVPERSYLNLSERKYFRILTNSTNDKFRIERLTESWFSRLFNLYNLKWNLILDICDAPLDFPSKEFAESFIEKIIKIETDSCSYSWKVIE